MLYAVIFLCAAFVGCLIYLTATGGMDKITEIARNKGKENNTTAAVTSSAAAEATASVSAAPSAAATVQPAQTPSSAPSSTPDTVSDDSLLRIVNHGQPLSPDYVPADLRTVNVNSLREEQLRSEAAASLEQMYAAAQADGGQLTLVSAYRSYE